MSLINQLLAIENRDILKNQIKYFTAEDYDRLIESSSYFRNVMNNKTNMILYDDYIHKKFMDSQSVYNDEVKLEEILNQTIKYVGNGVISEEHTQFIFFTTYTQLINKAIEGIFNSTEIFRYGIKLDHIFHLPTDVKVIAEAHSIEEALLKLSKYYSEINILEINIVDSILLSYINNLFDELIESDDVSDDVSDEQIDEYLTSLIRKEFSEDTFIDNMILNDFDNEDGGLLEKIIII